MASAAVVGGVLLALIEGMGIMFTKMMAPPSPEDMLAQAANDPTAPPTMGGLFPSIGGPGSSHPMGAPAASSSTAPPENEPFMLGDTTFSTESSSNVVEQPSSNSSWWPFGSSQDS
jgi:hypothetical protein